MSEYPQPTQINAVPRDHVAKRRLQDAMDNLWQRYPFFATVLRFLDHKEGPGFNTIGVNMHEMIYDPEFIKARPLDELVVILAHEASHIVFIHPLRFEDRHPMLWGIACDYAVNIFLHDCGLRMPKDATINLKYRNWLTEEIYEDLLKNNPQPKPGGDGQGGRIGDPNAMGIAMPEVDKNGKPVVGGEQAEAEGEAHDKIRKALDEAKKAGNMPGDMLRQLENLANPDRSLHDILKEFVAETLVPNDYSYNRPHRRHMMAGIVAPGIKKTHVGEIALVIDNSGSIDAHALSLFNVTVKSILEDLNPALAHVMYCDTRVHRFDSYDSGMIPDLDSRGGGGTDFRDPFNQLEQRGITPLVLLYFTDLECSSYAPDPGYPVCWVHWGSGGSVPPYGRVIPLRAT